MLNYRKQKYAHERELEEVEPSSGPQPAAGLKYLPHKTSTEGLDAGYNKSTQMLMEDNDYDQLPALKPSAVQTSDDNDYDQLPALVNKNTAAW